MSAQTFNTRLKAAFKRLQAAGIVNRHFNPSAHSLRRGCVTQVCSAEVKIRPILLEAHGRWNLKKRSRDMVHSAMTQYEDTIPEERMIVPHTLAQAIATAVASLSDRPVF